MKFIRLPYIIGLVALVLLLVGLGVRAYIYHEIFKTPAPADFPRPIDRTQAQRQDLNYLQETLHDIDRSFSKEQWRTFQHQIAGLSSKAGALTDAQFEMSIERAVALAHNGHTNMRAVGWGLTLNSIPLRFGWFAEGLFVVKTDPAHSALLGSKVVSEGSHTPEQVASVFHEYVGGRPTFSRELSPHFMESPAALNAAGLTPSASSVTLKFLFRDGSQREETVQAVAMPVNGPAPSRPSRHDMREHHWPRQDLSPVRTPGDPRVWKHVLDGLSTLPLTLRDPNRLYWETFLSGNVIYLQFNATVDQPGGKQSLGQFLDQVLRDVDARKPRYAIVDLRSNSGGDYELTTDFTREIPNALPKNGKLFILTSGDTFSAGIVMAARLKYFAGDRGVIVGQPMGDYEQFWAEGSSRIVLPNSRLMLSYATGFHDWEHGCTLWQLFICAPENYSYGVAAGKLSPQIPVAWSFSDYLTGQDTVLNVVLASIGVAGAKVSGAALSSQKQGGKP